MASPVVGYAAIQIIPSMRGVHQTIQRELDRGARQSGARAGQSIGSSMTDGLSRAMRGSMDAAYRALQTGAVVAGGAIATSLVKGWGRVTAIQDATAALSISLGDSAAAAALLDETLEVVRGTPFNLDQFASAAQQMVGMGVEAQKVPGYLEAIGEAAATQGGRATEMAGRLTTVFGQIAASGQVQLADIWRISDTGVNALGILANSFGVTRDEMKDMISSGAVPAGEALDALASGILEGTDGPAGATTALAGTMDELRQSMSGAVGGVESAMSRLGAAIIAPFGPAITAGAVGFTGVLDDLTDRADDLFGALANSDPVDRFIDLMEDAPARLGGLLDALADIGSLAGGAAGALGLMGSQAVTGLVGLGKLGGPLGVVAAGLAGIALSSPEARDALGDLAGSLGPILSDLGERLLPVIEAVSDSLDRILPAAIRASEAALAAIGGAAVTAVDALAPVAEALLAVATPVVVAGLEAVAAVLEEHGDLLVPVAAGWAAVRGAAMGAAVWQGIASGISTVTGHLSYMKGALDGIARTRGISTLQATLQTAGSSISSFMGQTVSAGQIAAGALAGVAVGATLALQTLERSAGNAREANERFLESIDFDPASSSIRQLNEDVQALAAELNSLDDEASRSDWAQLGQHLNPWSDNTITEARERQRELADLIDDQADRVEKLADVSRYLGNVGGDAVERWIERLDLDPATMSVGEMTTAIRNARYMAERGTPATEDLAGAFEELGDETASATDQLDAFSDALDALIGVNIRWEEAQDNITRGLNDLVEAAAEAEGWSTDLFGVDTASLDTQQRIRDLTSDALAAAEAFIEQGGSIEEAEGMLALYREGIIRTAESAGISRADVEEYLNVLGFIPEDIETVITAHTDPESLDAAGAALDLTASDRTVEMLTELDEVSRATAERYIGQTSRRRTATIDIEFNLDPTQAAIANRYIGQAQAYYYGRNSGGPIPGPNVNFDMVPAMLTPGEYVIRKDMVSKFGMAFFDALNAGRMPGYNTGGLVPARPMPTPARRDEPTAARTAPVIQQYFPDGVSAEDVTAEMHWALFTTGGY